MNEKHIPWIVGATGIVSLLVGILLTLQTSHSLKGMEVGKGKVISSVLIGGGKSRGQRIDVHFESKEGKVYRITDTVPSFVEIPDIGQQVEVLYQPGQPQQAQVKNTLVQWFYPIFFSGMGLFLLASSALFFVLFSKLFPPKKALDIG